MIIMLPSLISKWKRRVRNDIKLFSRSRSCAGRSGRRQHGYLLVGDDFDTSRTFGIDSDHAFYPNRYHGDSCAAESRVPTEWEKTHLLMSEDRNPSQDVVRNGDQRDDEVTK
jgi:hypothetical protein